MKYFSFSEFEKSAVASRFAIDNTIPADIKGNVEFLVNTLLDPIREHFGAPIIITSGYRCPQLNKAIDGASPRSLHMRGLAADFTTGNNIVNMQLFEWITDPANSLKFDLAIAEHANDVLSECKWIHIQTTPKNPRQLVLLA